MSTRRRHFQQERQRKFRGEAKTLPVFGEKEDENNFFHCWNCGFMNDVRNNTLGGVEETHATVLTAETESAQVPPYNGRAIDPASMVVSVQVDSSGDPIVIKEQYTIGGGGCPMCHTRNWRGDFRF